MIHVATGTQLSNWNHKREFTPSEIAKAAQGAIDNWDWDYADRRQIPRLEAMRDNAAFYCDSEGGMVLDRAYSDVWDWLDEMSKPQ